MELHRLRLPLPAESLQWWNHAFLPSAEGPQRKGVLLLLLLLPVGLQRQASRNQCVEAELLQCLRRRHWHAEV